MATSFDRWEKDPFFSAAEEVQESADRMESTYRTWMHAKKDASSIWDSEELCRDLRTTLGTAKWQLEEFERAVRSSYIRTSNDDSVDRHREFIIAIEANISKVESSLKESSLQEGKASVPWARLDERESNEFALFLAGPLESEDKIPRKSRTKEREKKGQVSDEELPSKGSTRSVEWGSNENKDEKPAENEKVHGHRRTASASIDSGVWKISVFDDNALPSSSAGQPLRKVPSLAGFFSSIDSAPKNGFRKWKATDCHQDSNMALLRPMQLTKGINVCYEKSKSCLDSCDDCYDKQLYGWYGAIQRQFQRSQYQMQYSRPVQMAIWIVLLLCLIVLIVLRVV